MSKYRILVEPGKDYNPEFPPPEAIRDGAELDGFIILGYRKEGDGRIVCGVIHETSISDVKEMLEEDENDLTTSIRAACALMDGEERAERIMKKAEVRKHIKMLSELNNSIMARPEDEPEILRLFRDEEPILRGSVPAPEDEVQEFPEDEEQRFPEED